VTAEKIKIKANGGQASDSAQPHQSTKTMQIPTSDHLSFFEVFRLFVSTGGLAVAVAIWRAVRRSERRILLLSLEHEDLIGDLKTRVPAYQRPGEKLAKAKRAMAGSGGF
jgi:hypothetical protein